MRIQHNIPALNSYRQLNGNNNALAKNLEKLSSGYRINRAGDDAAGLAISEKMRAQIRGLETAQKNAQDGISLVQTAEGALTEVHSMLNRMVELATQSSNGTFDNDTDRANLQKEVLQLKDEIDRISKATNFNGIDLLNGSMSAGGTVTGLGKIVGDANAAKVTTPVKGKFVMGAAVTAAAKGTAGTATIEFINKEGKNDSITVNYIGTGKVDADAGAIIQELAKDGRFSEYEFTTDGNGVITAEAKVAGQNKTIITKIAGQEAGTGSAVGQNANGAWKMTAAPAANQAYVVDGKTFLIKNTTNRENDEYTAADFKKELEAMGYTIFSADGKLSTPGTAWAAGDIVIKTGTGASAGNADGLQLQIGDTGADHNQLKLEIPDMGTKSLGISGVDVSTQAGAKDAIDKIKAAINTVSSVRGDLGAAQNRLEHTIENLGVTTENMTAAESRIRDTDMAKEMMNYTKNNILIQASQAMLAQANQVPQGVLQLLQ